jgi:shikimate kinase
LIGYRGAGKTSVARILAALLAWKCVDADTLLEERLGRTIRQIFEVEGEQRFRDKESMVLTDICREGEQVVATGGGVILREQNRTRLKASGGVVWLHADAEILWRRSQADLTTHHRRPTLTVGGMEEIEQLLRVREPLYRACADQVIDTSGLTPTDVAKLILAHWGFKLST